MPKQYSIGEWCKEYPDAILPATDLQAGSICELSDYMMLHFQRKGKDPIDPDAMTTLRTSQVESYPGVTVKNEGRLSVLVDKPTLLQFARRILQEIDPSVEWQILQALERIEEKLPPQ